MKKILITIFILMSFNSYAEKDIFKNLENFRNKYPCPAWEGCSIPSVQSLVSFQQIFVQNIAARLDFIEAPMKAAENVITQLEKIIEESNTPILIEKYTSIINKLNIQIAYSYDDDFKDDLMLSGKNSIVLKIVSSFIDLRENENDELTLLKAYKLTWAQLYLPSYELQKMDYKLKMASSNDFPIAEQSYQNFFEVNSNCEETPFKEFNPRNSYFELQEGQYLENENTEGLDIIKDYKVLAKIANPERRIKLNCVKVPKHNNLGPTYSKKSLTLTVRYSSYPEYYFFNDDGMPFPGYSIRTPHSEVSDITKVLLKALAF